jgi:hypothetical protein
MVAAALRDDGVPLHPVGMLNAFARAIYSR